MPSRTRAALIVLPSLVLLCLAAAPPASAAGTEWPHLRGPNLDGRVADGTLERRQPGLELVWRIPLGKGYSGIAVADGRAVTLFSDGTDDVAVAVDAGTGEERWRYRIADTYRGHDGSTDGPLSTPVIDDGVVYGLGPKGQLFALSLKDGKELWMRKLQDEFGAVEPDFGFTTTPLVADKVLVIQTGGPEGHSISGLDRGSGKTLWSKNDDPVDYQSPTLMTLAGKDQVVAVGDKRLVGLDPATGAVLWQHPLGEEDYVGSSVPTHLDGDRFLIFAGGAAAVFELARTDGGYELSEQYRSRELGGTYALPVYHDGNLYGFRGQFLTAVDGETGERLWRSRPPGGRGLILVDGHLVVLGAKGEVVVVEANPEGYVEKARLQTLDGGSYTWPSFADGKVYARNLEQMAAVAVVDAKPVETAAAGPEHEFGKFVREVEAAENKKSLIDAFLAEHESFPLVEGEYVHFVYRGEAEDVVIEGSILPGGGTDEMTRIAGTDFYYRTYRLEPGRRWEYRFVVDYEKDTPDPLNPRQVPAVYDDAPLSELAPPGYEPAAHLAEPEGERGTIETVTYKSEILGDERELRVYLPPGYAGAERAYPLLLVHSHDWLDRGLLHHTLDNLIGKTVEPMVAVFIAPSPQWWEEAGGSATDKYVGMLAEEMVPYLESKYRLEKDPASRAVMGREGFGLTAAYAALKHPDVFGKAAVWSAHLGMGHGDKLMALIEGAEKKGVEVYLDWTRHDVRRAAMGIDLRGDTRRLAEALEKSGFRVHGGEVDAVWGWGGARNRTDKVLELFFPAES